MINIARSLLNGSTGFKEPGQMAELEIREPGGDGSVGVANVGFQTALTVPTLSVSSNQGRGG